MNRAEKCSKFSWGRSKYITAYCHLRNAMRTFKRSRIKEIVPA